MFMPLFGKDDATAISKGQSLSICQTIIVLFRRFVCAREYLESLQKLANGLYKWTEIRNPIIESP